MSALTDTGFIIWGFFVLYALIIVLYYVWMVRANRADRSSQPRDPQE